MTRAGWVVNESNDQELAQNSILLRSQCDTIDLKFRIVAHKIEEIKTHIEEPLSKNLLHIKAVVKL